MACETFSTLSLHLAFFILKDKPGFSKAKLIFKYMLDRHLDKILLPTSSQVFDTITDGPRNLVAPKSQDSVQESWKELKSETM